SHYSQPKLELFGLYKALRHWRLYLIGVKNLRVEVDAQYISGMLKEPDIQPNATINRWIQGILLFNFDLRHVPAYKFKGPDALSRIRIDEDEVDEVVESDDDTWLDNIVLLTQLLEHQNSANEKVIPTYGPLTLPSCFTSRSVQESTLQKIRLFLTTLESPYFTSVQS
ncbi:hypothetical protein GYMLUDRAFT_104662, partial [Collybiopsis luxurians FD-317 M1]